MSKQARRHSFDACQESKDNNWNSVQEALLQSRGKQAKGYRWMHTEACKKYTFWYHVLGIGTIIITSASGTGAFIGAGLNMNTVSIAVGIFSYIGAVTSSLSKFMGLEALADKHRRSAVRFQVFISEIENQLSLKRCDRKDGKVYMEAVKNHFNKLLEEAPAINEGILSAFRKKFGDITNGIDTIHVKADNTVDIEKVVSKWKNNTKEKKDEIVIDMALQDEFEKTLKEQQKKSAEESIKFQLSRGTSAL